MVESKRIELFSVSLQGNLASLGTCDPILRILSELAHPTSPVQWKCRRIACPLKGVRAPIRVKDSTQSLLFYIFNLFIRLAYESLLLNLPLPKLPEQYVSVNEWQLGHNTIKLSSL